MVFPMIDNHDKVILSRAVEEIISHLTITL